jgi:nitrate reductase gamma subunit
MNVHDIYPFVSGPLVLIAFALFLGGLLYKFLSLALFARKKDPRSTNFTGRRILLPEVRYVTFTREYLVLLMVLAPFLTGFLAYHQIGPYDSMVILHILTGEILLVALLFTWLSHMITGFLIRAYMGSEFGSVRHARDW